MDKNCTVFRTLELVGKKWTLLIVLELYKAGQNGLRYNELKNSLPGATSRILSARLKEMQAKQLIKRKVLSKKIPVKSFYYLTDSGLALVEIIKDLKKWALKWKIHNKECEKKDCKDCEL
ncbi:winged helix-turn-helix transcriptional regulator [Pseudomonadota bacterium]